MPRIASLEVAITTGAVGRSGPAILVFNSHPIPLLDATGGTGPGETLRATFRANSFAHSVWIEGPPGGSWEIAGVEVTYDTGTERWQVRLGAVTLDAETSLDIWEERPMPVWDL